MNGKPLLDEMNEIYAEYGYFRDALDSFALNLEDGSWIAVRPSGTEPKIKIYYSVKGADKVAAEKKLEEIQDTIQTKLGLK